MRNTPVTFAMAAVLTGTSSLYADSVSHLDRPQEVNLTTYKIQAQLEQERLFNGVSDFRSQAEAGESRTSPEEIKRALSTVASRGDGISTACSQGGSGGPAPSPVPEPSSASLLAIGAACLAYLRRFVPKP